jgi:hypothetical protein
LITIDGTTYDIPIVSLKRKANFLDKYANRTEDGNLARKLIGVYFNYSLTLGGSDSTTVYTAVWNKLSEPTEFHTVTVPADDGTYTFTAYFANVGDNLRKRKDGKNHWAGLTVDFTAKSPARTP